MNQSPTQPRRPFISIILFTIVLLVLGLGLSPTLRVLVYTNVHEIPSDYVRQWALRRLASENGNAVPALIRIASKSQVPEAEEDAIWTVINKASAEVKTNAILDLVSRPSKDLNYVNLESFEPPKELRSRLIELAKSENATTREESWTLLCMLGQKLDIHHGHPLPADLRPVRDQAYSTFTTSESCPEFNLMLAMLLPGCKFNLPQNNALAFEVFEPYFAKQSRTRTRSFFSTLVPYALTSSIRFSNTDPILDQHGRYLWHNSRRGNQDRREVEISLRFLKTRSNPGQFVSTLAEFRRKDKDSPGLHYGLYQLRTKQSETILNYLRTHTPLTPSAAELKEFLEMRHNLESEDGARVTDEVCKGLISKNSLVKHFLSNFTMQQRGFGVSKQSLRRLREHCNNNKFPPTVLTACFQFIAPHQSIQFLTQFDHYTEVLEALNTTSPFHTQSRLAKLTTWLEHEASERKSRFISLATARMIDISVLANCENAQRTLSEEQLQAVKKSRKIHAEIQRHAASTCVVVLANQLKRTRKQLNYQDFYWFDHIDLKQLATAINQGRDLDLHIDLDKFHQAYNSTDRSWQLFSATNWRPIDKYLSKHIERFTNSGHLIYYGSQLITTFAQNYPTDQITRYQELLDKNPNFILGIPHLNCSASEKVRLWKRCESKAFPVIHACVGIDLGIGVDREIDVKIDLAIDTKANSNRSRETTRAKFIADIESRDDMAAYFEKVPCPPAAQSFRQPYVLAICQHDDSPSTHATLISRCPVLWPHISTSMKSRLITGYKSIELEDLRILSAHDPSFIRAICNDNYPSGDFSAREELLQTLGNLQSLATPTLPHLFKRTHEAISDNRFAETAMLISALTKIDRSGKTTIPLLIELAKNNSLSYVYRAIAICGLRRYYYLNRTQTDLKQLIAMLNSDLKTLAERSLERVTELREEER